MKWSLAKVSLIFDAVLVAVFCFWPDLFHWLPEDSILMLRVTVGLVSAWAIIWYTCGWMQPKDFE